MSNKEQLQANNEALAQMISDMAKAPTVNEFKAHIENKENPHEVTAEQIGAATTEYVDNAVANVKIPMIVSTEDITAGVTELPEGTLYLVIE